MINIMYSSCMVAFNDKYNVQLRLIINTMFIRNINHESMFSESSYSTTLFKHYNSLKI